MKWCFYWCTKGSEWGPKSEVDEGADVFVSLALSVFLSKIEKYNTKA
jgi:hypothetical protein